MALSHLLNPEAARAEMPAMHASCSAAGLSPTAVLSSSSWTSARPLLKARVWKIGMRRASRRRGVSPPRQTIRGAAGCRPGSWAARRGRRAPPRRSGARGPSPRRPRRRRLRHRPYRRRPRPRRFRRRLRHHPHRLRRPIRPVRMTIRLLIATVVLARRVMTAIPEIADQRTTTISRRASSVARVQRMTTTA